MPAWLHSGFVCLSILSDITVTQARAFPREDRDLTRILPWEGGGLLRGDNAARERRLGSEDDPDDGSW